MTHERDRAAAHVDRFNAAVRSGDYAAMTAHFTEDAELVFQGVPVGPFVGRGAITAAYTAHPPDDEVRIVSVVDDGNPTVLRYAWLSDPGGAAGSMTLTWSGEEISRLVVSFDPTPRT